MTNKEPYDPTLKEIADECRKIRDGWSEETHRSRSSSLTKAVLRESLAWTPIEYTEMEVAKALGSTSWR